MLILNDTRIRSYKSVIAPEALKEEYPVSDELAKHIEKSRQQVSDILNGKDDRILVVVGPCSIHDKTAAIDYAKKLKPLSDELKKELFVTMRIYFEKPRTTVGWKGLINDPNLDESFDINKGLRTARELMVEINRVGLPISSEFLDLLSPQYTADLVTWGAIGARTTESQGHRELASGLSCPVGFKNGTSGSISIARDALLSSRNSHIFMGINKSGNCSIVQTKGNKDCHLILRGGKKPNYDAVSVDNACKELTDKKLFDRLMIDFSHGNSLKQHKRQLLVAEDVAQQISNGENRIIGVMIESFFKEGNQSIDLENLEYGKSVTDACIGWEDTEEVMRGVLARAVVERRKIMA